MSVWNDRVRVVLVSSSFFPAIGGKEVVIHNLLKEHKENGQVQARLVRFGGLRYRLSKSFPYDYHVFPLMFRNKSVNIVLGLFLEKILFGIDVVHLHGIYPLGLEFVKYRSAFRYKLVLTPHGDDIQKVPEIGYGVRLQPNVEEEVKVILEGADAVTAISPIIVKDIRKLCKIDPVIIPNGVYVAKFRSPELMKDAEKIRQELGVGKDTKIILAVGRNHIKKGFDVLIMAMAIVRREVPNSRLVIVGVGCESLRPLISSLKLDREIVLTGRVPKALFFDPMEFEAPDRELVGYYLASDVFVMSSFVESFGVVTIEAMAAGKPVVATRLAEKSDASGGVIDGYNGFLVEPGNVDQMAEKIIVLLKNDAMREKMGRKSREIVQTFDWSEIGKKYVRLYGDVCNK